MFRFNLAYRHGNGEVEGFSAERLTKEAARDAAVAKAREKASHTPHPFKESGLILSDKGLTADERKTVRADWEIESRV